MEFRLDFHLSSSTEDEPETFLTGVAGNVLAVSEESDTIWRAGVVRLFLADLEAAVAADPSFDPTCILDRRVETQPFHAFCDARTQGLKRRVESDTGKRNLLILDRFELLPAFRGQGDGLRVLYRCIQLFGRDCALVVLHCCPLQFGGGRQSSPWRSALELDALGTDRRSCTAKLKNHYRKLGFKTLGRSDLMYLDPDLPRPALGELPTRQGSP